MCWNVNLHSSQKDGGEKTCSSCAFDTHHYVSLEADSVFWRQILYLCTSVGWIRFRGWTWDLCLAFVNPIDRKQVLETARRLKRLHTERKRFYVKAWVSDYLFVLVSHIASFDTRSWVDDSKRREEKNTQSLSVKQVNNLVHRSVNLNFLSSYSFRN